MGVSYVSGLRSIFDDTLNDHLVNADSEFPSVLTGARDPSAAGNLIL